MVKILDCTLRDGGHNDNWNYSSKDVINSIEKSLKLNTDFFEIGYRNHFDRENKGNFYYCTPEILKKFYPLKKNLQLGIMVDTSRYCADDFEDSKTDYCDFIRIATHPQDIEKTLDIAHFLHNKGYNIFVQLMEIQNVKNEHYLLLKNWTHKNILQSLYIADTYSQVIPQNIKDYFDKLNSIGYEKISFHAHNKSGLALENTLAAIKFGAYSVDVTQDEGNMNLNIHSLNNNI